MDKSKLLISIAGNLRLSVIVDADKCTKEKCDAIFEDGVVSLSVWDPYLLVHELVHVIQHNTNSFSFSFSELVVYSLSKGIPFDKEFAPAFLPFWKESVAKGVYKTTEFELEMVSFYCQFAKGGWDLFISICKDADVI